MGDVDKALSGGREWKEQTSYNGWTAEVTPQFDIREGYDFYGPNFLPLGDMADVLCSWASERAAAQRAIENVAACKVALFGSRLKFPLVDESNLNEAIAVNVDSCHRKEGLIGTP